MSKIDMQLKQDVDQELRWDPTLDAERIEVTVAAGEVTLRGNVGTYAEKAAAQAAVKRVGGVRGVEQELRVVLRAEHRRDDRELAEVVQNVLEWDVFVPRGVTAEVKDGWVTLEGNVAWNFQRDAAERAMQHTVGVVGATNCILLQNQATALAVKEQIEHALRRQAKADARAIQVEASGGEVMLTGDVTSWRAIEDATDAAWAAPGVTKVVARMQMTMTT